MNYEGGKTVGKGSFGWPSGANYEGDFKSSFIVGKGTSCSSGYVYRGRVIANLKQGKVFRS